MKNYFKILKEINTDLKVFGLLLLVFQSIIVAILYRVTGGITGEDFIVVLIYLIIFFIVLTILFIFYVRFLTPITLKKQIDELKEEKEQLNAKLNDFYKKYPTKFHILECNIEIDIISKDKVKYSRYEKLKCLTNNTEDIKEIIESDGVIDNFYDRSGTPDCVEDSGGKVVYVTKFPHQLSNGDIIERITGCEFIESFMNEEEYWIHTHYSHTDKNKFTFIFPSEVIYKEFNCKRIIGHDEYKISYNKEEKVIGGRLNVFIEYSDTPILLSNKFTWKW